MKWVHQLSPGTKSSIYLHTHNNMSRTISNSLAWTFNLNNICQNVSEAMKKQQGTGATKIWRDWQYVCLSKLYLKIKSHIIHDLLHDKI